MENYIATYDQTIGEGVTGNAITLQVINVKGSDVNAPRVYIQSSIHGAEAQGNAVVYYLLNHLKQQQPLANITLVSHCNPIAANFKLGEYTFGRFDPITGENWNRAYSYHKEIINDFVASLNNQNQYSLSQIYFQFRKRLLSELNQLNTTNTTNWGISTRHLLVNFLQSLAYQADIVLDLHTASCAIDHLYVPSYAKASAKYFNMSHYFLMDKQFAFALDEAIFCPWWDLVDALREKNYKIDVIPVEAYTVELGSQEMINLSLAEKQSKNILNYLIYKGAISGEAKLFSTQYFCHIDNYKTLYAPFGGLYEFVAKPGDDVRKGQVICQCLKQNSIIPILAPEDGKLISHFASSIIPKGAELAKLMTQIKTD